MRWCSPASSARPCCPRRWPGMGADGRSCAHSGGGRRERVARVLAVAPRRGGGGGGPLGDGVPGQPAGDPGADRAAQRDERRDRADLAHPATRAGSSWPCWCRSAADHPAAAFSLLAVAAALRARVRLKEAARGAANTARMSETDTSTEPPHVSTEELRAALGPARGGPPQPGTRERAPEHADGEPRAPHALKSALADRRAACAPSSRPAAALIDSARADAIELRAALDAARERRDGTARRSSPAPAPSPTSAAKPCPRSSTPASSAAARSSRTSSPATRSRPPHKGSDPLGVGARRRTRYRRSRSRRDKGSDPLGSLYFRRRRFCMPPSTKRAVPVEAVAVAR